MSRPAVTMSQRRVFLRLGVGTALAVTPLCRAMADVLSELSSTPKVTIEQFSADGKSTGIVRVAKVIRSDAEWKKLLPADVYRVVRAGAADKPYTGTYWSSHADGIYRCVCCETALFDNQSKYESGTGWPSFWQPVSALNVAIAHNQLSCSLCDAHLGLLMGDGPGQNGLHYSVNTLALKFVAKA